MKKLGIIVVVLAAVLLVAPYGIGKVAEKRLNAGLDKLIEQAPYFKIAERTWTGGWFKSEQVVTFELADSWSEALGSGVAKAILDAQKGGDAALEAEGAEEAGAAEGDATGDTAAEAGAATEAVADAAEEAAAEDAAGDEGDASEPAVAATPVRFTIRNEVLHGPVLGFSGLGLARVDTHVDLNDDIRQKIAEVFGPEPAFEVSTRVGFFGGGTTTFKSEGRKLNIKDENVDFTYETFKMSVGVSGDMDSYDIDGGLPSVVVNDKGDGTNFTMTDLSLTGEGERVLDDLYDGDFAFKIKEVKFKGKGGGEEVRVADAHYLVNQTTKNDFVDMTAKFGTGEVKSADISQTGVEIKEIHYDFSLRHLHAPTLAKIIKGIRAVYTTPLVDPTKLEEVVFAPMKEHAGELLQHDPVFGIDRIGLVTPEGEIVAKGQIKLVGATPEDFSAPGGMGLIAKLDADITIEAAQKVLEKFPNGATMAGGAVDSGYAKREGDKLVCHIQFKNGELTINGKPQAIPGLGGPPPASMEEGSMDEGAMDEGAGEEASPQE